VAAASILTAVIKTQREPFAKLGVQSYFVIPTSRTIKGCKGGKRWDRDERN
jgi:hypothetical protein